MNKKLNTAVAVDAGTHSFKIGDTSSSNIQRYPSNESIFSSISNGVSSCEKVVESYLRDTIPNKIANKLLIETPPFLPSSYKKALCERFLDYQHIGYYYSDLPQVFALYATGKTSGLVIDFGYLFTYVVPIYEGFPIYHAIEKFNSGSKAVKEIIEQKTSGILRSEEIDMIITEKCKFKRADQIKSDKVEEYHLPDGKLVSLQSDAIYATNALFSTKTNGQIDHLSVHVTQSLAQLDADTSRQLRESTVICGGISQCPGLLPRLNEEFALDQLVIEDTKNRNILGLLGAAKTVTLSCFDNKWMSKKDLLEGGYYYFN